MSDLKILLKVGPASSKQKIGYERSETPATLKVALKKFIVDALHVSASKSTDKYFRERIERVQKHVRDDLEKFTVQALKYFFHLQSDAGQKSLRIDFSEFKPQQSSGLGFKMGFRNSDMRASEATTIWPALSPRTVRNKKGNRTYFVHTGELHRYLEGNLLKFFQKTMTPTIRYIPDQPEDVDDTTRRVGKLEISIAAGKRGLNLTNLPSLTTGQYRDPENKRPGGDFGLLSKYMGEEVAWKLTNLGHEQQANRPLVIPLMGYYILSRFPIVLESALKKHFRIRDPNPKARRND